MSAPTHNTTTRRYPRSLSEAFPADRACAIERPSPSFSRVCNVGHLIAWLVPVSIAVMVLVMFALGVM